MYTQNIVMINRTIKNQLIEAIMSAFEFKWGEKEVSSPKAFRMNYPDAGFKTINSLNFYDFLK